MMMTIFRKIVLLFKEYSKIYSGFELKSTFLNFYPKELEEGIVYIISDGPLPDTILLKCPCGCKADIYLNLLNDTLPCWSYNLNKRGKISIEPSIWRKIGCRSHFFITDGKVINVTTRRYS